MSFGTVAVLVSHSPFCHPDLCLYILENKLYMYTVHELHFGNVYNFVAPACAAMFKTKTSITHTHTKKKKKKRETSRAARAPCLTMGPRVSSPPPPFSAALIFKSDRLRSRSSGEGEVDVRCSCFIDDREHGRAV